MDQKYYQDFEGRMTYMSPIIESQDHQQSPNMFGGEVKNALEINIYDYSIQQQRHKQQLAQDENSSHGALFQGQNLSDAQVNMQISTSNHNPISTLQSIQSDKHQQQQYVNMLQNSQALANNNTTMFQQNIEAPDSNYGKQIEDNPTQKRENRLSFQPINQEENDLDAFAEQIEQERNENNQTQNDNSQFIMSQLEKDCNNFSQIENKNQQMNGSVPAGFVSPYVGMFSENFAKSASKRTPFDSIENNIINLEHQMHSSAKGKTEQSFKKFEQRSRASTNAKIKRSSSQKSDKQYRETLLNNNFDYNDGPENKVVHTHTDIQERPASNLRGSRGSSHSLRRSIQKSRGAFNRCSSNNVQIVRNAQINVQNSNNPLQDLIKDCLVKFAEQQGTNLLSERMLNQINLNQNNKLLSVIDAGMQDNQLQFLLEVVDAILESNGSDPNQNFNEDFVIKGINLNSNIDLTDNSLKLLTEFVIRHRAIKVLSIERFKVSHSSLTYLFQMLPETKVVELNISGIPLSFFCIDLLCQILYNQRRNIDLRVLHMRNTKLQDVSALKLFQYIFGQGLSEPIRVKYLSMSMNNTLGYKFQNGVVKMFQDHKGQFLLKYLDIKFCNLTQQNIQIIQKIIQQNNELNMKDKSGGKCSLSSLRSAKKATIKQSSRFAAQSRSQKKIQPNKQPAQDIYHQAFEKRQNLLSNLRRSYEPYLSKPNDLQNVRASQGSGEMVVDATKTNLMQSLPGLNSMGTLYKQEGLFQQTENDVNNRLRDSTTEILYTDQKGFSRSCNSRQPKSQSLQEIFTRGNDRTNTSLQNGRSQSSNTANNNVRSSVFSQNLIDNLNTFDLLNDVKGIKNISSKQLILQSVNQLLPNIQPSQTTTDQNLNLNHTAYKGSEQQSEQIEKTMMDQTFQKMNMQAYTDQQNQPSQMIPNMNYGHHLDGTIQQQFGIQMQSQDNIDQAYGNNIHINSTTLDPYSNMHSSTGGNLSHQFSSSQISNKQGPTNIPLNIHQISNDSNINNHFRMFSSAQPENFIYHNRKSSIKSLGSISGSVSSSNNNTIKTDHNQPPAAIAKINLLDLQRKSHNDMEKLKVNNKKKTRSIDSKSRRSGSFTRYGSLPKQRLITKAPAKAKSVKSNKSAGSKKGQIQEKSQMKFNRSTKSHNIIGERMLNLSQNNPKKGTQDLASNVTTLMKSQKNEQDKNSNDRYSNEQSKNGRLSTKRNSMTLLERQRLSLESIGSRQNYINRDFRSIQYQPQQQNQPKLSFRPTCGSKPHLDPQDVRNLSQQRLKKLQQNQLFKQQQQAMKKPKYITKQQEAPQQHQSQFIVRDIDMENRYLRESRLLNTNELLKSSASYNSNKIMNLNLNQVQENAGYINQSQINDLSQLSSIQSQFPLLDQSQLYENNNFQQPIQLDSRKNTQNSRKELTTNSSYHHLGQQFACSDDQVVGDSNMNQHQISFQMNPMQNPSMFQKRLSNINYLNFQQPISQQQPNISLSSIQTTMPSSILNSNRAQVGRFKQPKYLKNKFNLQNGRKNSGSRDFSKGSKMNCRSRDTAKNKVQHQRQQAATKYVKSKNNENQSCPNYSTENVKLSLADLMSLQKQQEMLQKKRVNYGQNIKFYDNHNNSMMVNPNQSTASWNHDLSYLSHQVRANNYIPPNMHKDEIFTGGAECMPINSKNYSMRSEMPVPSMTNRTNITNHTNLTHQTNHTNSTNRVNHVNNHLNQVIVGNPSPLQHVSQKVSNLGTRMESITSSINASCPQTCKNYEVNQEVFGGDQGLMPQHQQLRAQHHVQRFPSNYSRNQFQTINKDDDKTQSSRQQQRAKKSTGQKKGGLLSQRQLNDRSGRIISRSTNDLNRNPDSSYKQPVIMPSISRSNSNLSKMSGQNVVKDNTHRIVNPELGTHFSEEQLHRQQAAYYQYNNVPIQGAYSQVVPTDERDNTKSCSSLTTSHPSQHQQPFVNNGQHLPMNSIDKKEEFCDLRNMIMSEITRLQSLYKKIDDYMVVEGGPNGQQNQNNGNQPSNYNIHKTIPRGHKQVNSTTYQDFY